MNANSLILTVILAVVSERNCILVGEPTAWGLGFTYHDSNSIEKFFKDTVLFFPNFAEVYSIGKSVQGTDLLVLKLSAPSRSVLGTPHVKFIGNIHGNEPVGKELILHLIQYLLRRYPEDAEVQSILNTTVIHFLPNMNPDGNEVAIEGECSNGPGRHNGNGVDLNRNFPDQFREISSPRQPETQAIIDWLSNHSFVLSASLHGGTLVVNYPLDNTPGGPPRGLNLVPALNEFLETMEQRNVTGRDLLSALQNYTEMVVADQNIGNSTAASADDDVFEKLARTYAEHHVSIHKGDSCRATPVFPGGITRGAQWYALTGGMQDYNYLQQGCMELTLEISCCKYPLAQHLPRLWEDNRRALLELTKQANTGVRGQVLSASDGRTIPDVILQIVGRNVTFSTSRRGEFWRILLPGDYLLQAEAPGFEPQVHPFRVSEEKSSAPTSTWLSVYLRTSVKESSLSGAAQKLHSSFEWFSSLAIMIFLKWLGT